MKFKNLLVKRDKHVKNKKKFGLLTVSLLGVALLASGCTANFCSNDDKTRIAFAIEPGVSEYYNNTEYQAYIAENSLGEFDVVNPVIEDKLYQVIKIADGRYTKAGVLNDIIATASQSGVYAPSHFYFSALDKKVLYQVAEKQNIDLNNTTHDEICQALKAFGSSKFAEENNEDIFSNYKVLNNELREELGYTVAASIDFEKIYISNMTTKIDAYRSCITVYNDVEYGNYGEGILKTVKLDKITWGEAWGKGGHVIEGLVVYPVAWLIDNFAVLFAGGKNATPAEISAQYATGVPQLLSLIVVTIIVRLFIFLVTIKSTLSQKKMTDLQPELAKIQQKYPNANTNQSQKQRLAEEQMRLYKKHHVNPLSQLLVLIIQFPVFIGVWGAMTGSAALSTGAVLDLDLSQSIWQALMKGPKVGGWWPALVLIILMSVSQFFSMKVPQWIQKAKTKKVARLGRNPAQKSQNKTANIVSYVMLIMIIVMGFTLPAAMGVYWFIGAIVSLLQTVLTSYVFVSKKHKK